MPLRFRLALGFALGTALLIGVVGLGFVLQLRASLDATQDVALASRATTLSEQYASEGIADFKLSRDEEPVQVLRADGSVLTASPSLDHRPILDPGAVTAVFRGHLDGSGPLSFTGDQAPDGRTRFLATVLSDRDGLVLVVGGGTDVADAADEHVDHGLMVLGPVAVLVAGVAAWWLAGAALRPVERMRRQTAELADHDDGTHLVVPATHDEIAALAVTMNGLLDRQRQALGRERDFVADAGHELRTPLATLRAELELAGRPGRDSGELRAAVHGAAGETDRLIRLAEDLLTLTRAEGDQAFLRPRRIDLAVLAADATRAATALADDRDVDIVVDGPAELQVVADPDRVRQAVDNLLANAVRHSPDHGVVEVSLADQPSGVQLAVADSGYGFPEAFLPHAFERFRRADTARARAEGGSGLGLSIVAAVARAHGGRVVAGNRAEGGARVEMHLPSAHEPSATDDGVDGPNARNTTRTGARAIA